MDQTAPVWGLTIVYWLHMLATVIWIGGLAALVWLVLPAAGSLLEPETYAKFLGSIQRRLDPLGWLCLLVLVGTGLFQMSENDNYQGFLVFDNPWAAAILIKHLVFFVMIGVNAWTTWGVLPGLQRAALLQARGKISLEAPRLQKRSLLLLRINLVLSIIVLALTALARVS